MSRTNIEIDDQLLERVMKTHGLRTKREAVDRALRALDLEPMSRAQLLELQGMGWDGDLDGMRGHSPTVDSWLSRDSS